MKTTLDKFGRVIIPKSARDELGLSPGLSWEFAPGWPLGIRNGILRAFVLGTAGGGFVLIVNAILRALYQRRLRLG